MHTHTKEKASSHYRAIATQCTNTGMPGTTQTLKPCVVNPPGLRLVTQRKTVQVSHIEVVDLKIPLRPQMAKSLRQEQLSICFPNLH